MFFKLPMLAIDIGSSSIKIMEASRSAIPTIKKISISSIPPGLVVNGIIQDPAALHEILSQMLNQMKIFKWKRRVMLSLSAGTTIIKKIGFPPSQTPEELQETINYEAEQAFQHDINELYFDYHLFPGTPESLESSAVMVGAKRDIVEAYISLVRGLGLRVGIIDSDVLAIVNLLENVYGVPEGISVVANIGFSSTQLIFVNQGEFLYSREIPIGGDSYSRNISDQLHLSIQESENLKNMYSNGAANQDVKKIIIDMNDQLANEIQSGINVFFQSGEAPSDINSISNIFLTGGGAHMKSLDVAVASSVQKPVSILDPFTNIKLNKKVENEKSLTFKSMFSIASALSLRANEMISPF